jgi:hypothetical protein
LAKENTVTRRIIHLVIENTEMTSREIIEKIHGAGLTSGSAEARRVRVALHTLCAHGWLKHIIKHDVGYYRYAKRWPPSAKSVIHGKKPSIPLGTARLAAFLSATIIDSTRTSKGTCE